MSPKAVGAYHPHKNLAQRAIRAWMVRNLDRFIDRCGEVDCTGMVEEWDRETQDGGVTLDPDHVAWRHRRRSRARLRKGPPMNRKIHPDRFVTFVQAYVQVTPATELIGRRFDGGEQYKIADVPERRTEYRVGQELQFGSVNAARAFVKAVNAEAGADVCRIGRV